MLDPSFDICTMNFLQVGNAALRDSKVQDLVMKGSNAKVTHRMIVTPDDKCVNFHKAAAWGQVGRSVTWYPSNTASLPATQVHEIGHNFGMMHSGNDTTNGFEEYADATGYMSNRMSWSKDGDKMCFNAAKMWYFGWYSANHEEMEPSANEKSVGLIALDDLRTGKYEGGEKKSILRLNAGVGQGDLFIMFNRRKGMNEEVRGDADKVVIVEQKGRSAVSRWKGAIKNGATYSQVNWGGVEGNTLYIKNVFATMNAESSSEYDYSTIQVYTSATPSSAPPDSKCTDNPQGWYDSDGADYNCQWYALVNNCSNFGNGYANNGITANEACCACGGGNKGNSKILSPGNSHRALAKSKTNIPVKSNVE